jgi:hypothetical protein
VCPSTKTALGAAPAPLLGALCFENTSGGPAYAGTIFDKQQSGPRGTDPFSWPKVSIGYASLTTKRGEIEAKSFVIKDLTRKSFRFKDQSQNFLLTL